MTSDDLDYPHLMHKLRASSQQHLLRHWDELDDPGRARLATQIAAIDFDLIASLFRGEVDQPDWAALSRRARPAPAVRLDQRLDHGNVGAAEARGREALAAGEVGVLLVAGGQGSRLGFKHPKSMYPIGPLSGASLMQIHIEKVRAAARRYGLSIPLYVMTSPPTRDATVEFLAANGNFGLADDDLFAFCQGAMPAVDAATGKLLLADKDRLFMSPDGHGGTVAALAASGAIDDMHRRGIRQLFYLQVDNPLAPICDERLIGHHLLAESELTSLAIAKASPQEKLGNFALVDGRLHVIEYSDFPDDVAEQRDDSGKLVFWAGSVAIHVFDVAFLERSLTLRDSLPFHIARKKVACLDNDGELIQPSAPNALKFERFIFDLLPQAERAIVVEYEEHDVMAPLKNAPGAPKDTPEYVQRLMLDQHRRWLTAAGATVESGVDVEVSPLFGFDAAAVAQRIEPGRRFAESQYLGDGA